MNIYLNNDNYDLDEILEKNPTEETEKILQKLWKDSQASNQIILSYYGRVLRKLDKQIEFIDICRKFIRNGREITNKYVLSCLCWCIYDYYIQSYESNDKECLEKFIKEAKYIKDNCEQKEDYSNPYVLTVMKVLKIYNKGNMRNKKNLNAILEWISYLNPEKLSEKVFKYKDKNGEEREKASEKELYYQYKVKALEKLDKENEGLFIYNLGTGTGYSVLDMVKAFEKATGKNVPYKIAPRREGDIATCYADPKKAKEELGWEATKTLDDMCKDSWNYIVKGSQE
mgnify:CR=1 FL=1